MSADASARARKDEQEQRETEKPVEALGADSHVEFRRRLFCLLLPLPRSQSTPVYSFATTYPKYH
jgi:hypothetical protein